MLLRLGDGKLHHNMINASVMAIIAQSFFEDATVKEFWFVQVSGVWVWFSWVRGRVSEAERSATEMSLPMPDISNGFQSTNPSPKPF